MFAAGPEPGRKEEPIAQEPAPEVSTESIWADPVRARRVKRTGLLCLSACALVFALGVVAALGSADWAAVGMAAYLLAFAVWILAAGWPRRSGAAPEKAVPAGGS